MIVSELAYKVTLQADEFLNGKRKVKRGVEDLEKETKAPLSRIKKGFGEAADSASEFGEQGKNAFTKVRSGLAQFLGVAITLEAFRRGFLSTTKTLVDLGNSSSFLNMGTKSLEGFNRAAAATGSSEQSMTSMLMRLKNAKNWQAFPMGAPDATTIATQQLQGMTGVDIMGGKDPGDMLLKTASALRKLNKDQAQVMWGSMGGQSDMFNLMYSEPMDKLVSKYTKGSNATDAAVKRARDVNKALQDLNQTVSNLGNDMVMAFGPTVNEGLKQFSDWIANNKDDILGFFKEGSEWAKEFSDAVGGSTNALILLVGMRAGPVGALASIAYVTGNSELMKDFKEGDKGSGISPVESDGSWYGAARKALRNKIGAEGMQQIEDFLSPLLDAIRGQESGGDSNAVSKKGATGQYQFMAPTARGLGLRVDDEVDERKDPEKARAKAGIYMSELVDHYDGNLVDALMAYNWGMGNMDKWIERGRPDEWVDEKGKVRRVPQETMDYPAGIAKHYSDQINMASRPSGVPGGNTDNSQTNSTHINTVNVNGNPQSVSQLQKDIDDKARRSKMTITLASGNR
ncbi:transglycosylase SLT domain-containing protein [Aeromonas sp.]|uniref:transglycosylase SLT domain-containing protein n=1 Tax=Aeromonas sp. TaxID=647 RepID=UPI002590EF2F|nr:transglycosylase SLT domain-containing protein [Aeromonas sp.]MCX7132710.1 transglycosylase SLT domain-containing protein [Aeromonas sp.]